MTSNKAERRARRITRLAMREQTYTLGQRSGELPPPPGVVWDSLADPRRPHSRPWLNLLEDEVEPVVMESVRPTLVIWTSIWPKTADQLIRFDLSPRGEATTLMWTLTSPYEMDSSALGHRRFRLNKLLWEDLRYSYGQ
jgi:hypothetical protein